MSDVKTFDTLSLIVYFLGAAYIRTPVTGSNYDKFFQFSF